jgi:hypothetical protein
MPAHLFLAYFTGVAFIAAGLAIATHIFSRLASNFLGLMFFLWVVALHAPRVIAKPHNADELTSLFVARILRRLVPARHLLFEVPLTARPGSWRWSIRGLNLSAWIRVFRLTWLPPAVSSRRMKYPMRQQRNKEKNQQNDRKDSENYARNALRIHCRILHE